MGHWKRVVPALHVLSSHNGGHCESIPCPASAELRITAPSTSTEHISSSATERIKPPQTARRMCHTEIYYFWFVSKPLCSVELIAFLRRGTFKRHEILDILCSGAEGLPNVPVTSRLHQTWLFSAATLVNFHITISKKRLQSTMLSRTGCWLLPAIKKKTQQKRRTPVIMFGG